MKTREIVPTDSRYIPLTQQNWCCVPTCIQIVMLRYRLPLVPAEQIGYEMGLIVPDKASKFFWNARTGAKPPAGYGTQAGRSQYSPNVVFKKLNIPLKMSWSLINKFKSIDNFGQYLSEVEKNDKDILICFDWPTLFNIKEKEHWGHVCVLDRVYLESGKVRIIDPDVNSPKWRIVKIDDLYKAMVFHGNKKSAGFWEISFVG